MPGKVSLGATLLAGVPVNFSGAVSAFIFIITLAEPIMRKLNRLMIKHGLE